VDIVKEMSMASIQTDKCKEEGNCAYSISLIVYRSIITVYTQWEGIALLSLCPFTPWVGVNCIRHV